VLVVTHLFPTGMRDIRGPWVAEQVDALAKLTDIRVLCCSGAATDWSETRPSGVSVTYRTTRTVFGVGHLGLLGSSIRYHRALGRYLRSEPAIRLVHAHFGIPDAIVAFQHTHRTRRPLVVTLHGSDAIRVLPRGDPIGWVTRRAVAGAEAVICVSSAIAEVVRAVLPAVEPVVIANGYDDRLFKIADTPRDLGLLFVGTLVPVKSLVVLLRAYASVCDRVSAPLTLAGDGTQRPALESLAAELGIADRVQFVGADDRAEVAGLMQRASALLLPSLSEGWPLVIGEAMACGTPVVASRVGGIPDIVASDDGGILVQPGDEAGLAEALVAILERPYDPLRVAAASRARPWSVQARLIAAVYDDALGTPDRTIGRA
jgi:teichuronic acid biosynthesis glycosyltransferase TuaC